MKYATAALLPMLMFLPTVPASAQDHVELGGGVLVLPAHEGARDFRVIPLPLIDVAAGPVFVNTTDGLGIRTTLDGVTVGAAATYLIGYRRRDVRDGAARLSDGVGARAFARAPIGPVIATIGMTKGIAGGTGGVIGDASISMPLVVSDRLVLSPTVGINWADERHNHRYFASNELPNPDGYRGKSGFKDVAATFAGRFAVTERIELAAVVGITHLLPIVSGAPMVERATSVRGLAGLSYRF